MTRWQTKSSSETTSGKRKKRSRSRTHGTHTHAADPSMMPLQQPLFARSVSVEGRPAWAHPPRCEERDSRRSVNEKARLTVLASMAAPGADGERRFRCSRFGRTRLVARWRAGASKLFRLFYRFIFQCSSWSLISRGSVDLE